MRYPANELWGNDLPICPYCRKVNTVEKDWADFAEVNIKCGHCLKAFTFQVHRDIKFSTKGNCKLNNELPHTLQFEKKLENTSYYHCTKCKAEFYSWELHGGEYPEFEKDEYVILKEPPEFTADF